MKTIFAGIIALACCCACNGGKGNRATTNESDSLMCEGDSLATEEVGIPGNADELFDDFIYHYTASEPLQNARTVFPLLYIKEGDSLYIEKQDWRHDYLYTKETFYTILFDSEEEMELVQDITADSVTVEWLYLDTRQMRQYHFRRTDGLWRLTSIELRSTVNHPNEDFLEFFYKFSNDSLFQRNHIREPLRFVTADPDDEFSIIETTLELDQWFAFRPLLPSGKMTNISYGRSCKKNSRLKIIDLRGNGNGFDNTLYFKRKGDEWQLTRFEDLSN